MAFDPAADPWGAAMLGAATVVALAVFILVAAVMTGTPKRAGSRILGVGCLLFLGCAIAGTAARIAAADRGTQQAAKPRPEPVTIIAAEPPPDPDAPGTTANGTPPLSPATVPAVGAPAVAAPAVAASDDPNEPAPSVQPPAPAVNAFAPTTPAAVEPKPVTLPPPPTLPEGGAARQEAIAAILRDGKAAVAQTAACGDMQRVAETWIQLDALPHDTPGLAGVVAKLEACRKRLRAAKAYSVHRQRVEARNAYAEALPAMLKSDDSYVFVSVRGVAHERMRIGGKSITEARIAAVLAGGLAAQLEALGFAEVTFASGKSTTTKKYTVLDDATLTTQAMAPWGLAERLTVD